MLRIWFWPENETPQIINHNKLSASSKLSVSEGSFTELQSDLIMLS